MDFAASLEAWHPGAAAAYSPPRCTSTTAAGAGGLESARLQVFAGLVAFAVLVFSWRRGTEDRKRIGRNNSDSDSDSDEDDGGSTGDDSSASCECEFSSDEDGNYCGYDDLRALLDGPMLMPFGYASRGHVVGPALGRMLMPAALVLSPLHKHRKRGNWRLGTPKALRSLRDAPQRYTQPQQPLFGSHQYAAPQRKSPAQSPPQSSSQSALLNLERDRNGAEANAEHEHDNSEQLSESPMDLSDDEDDEISAILATAAQVQIMHSSARLSGLASGLASADEEARDQPTGDARACEHRLHVNVRPEDPSQLPLRVSPGVVARLGLILPQAREFVPPPRMLHHNSPSAGELSSSCSASRSGRTSGCASSTWDFLSEAVSEAGTTTTTNSSTPGDGSRDRRQPRQSQGDEISVSLTNCSSSTASEQ